MNMAAKKSCVNCLPKTFCQIEREVLRMTRTKPVQLLVGLIVLSGCSSQVPVKVEPTLMSSSVDFTSPATVAGNSAPVYVLPVINTGWEKAYVDPRTGTWKSGRYTATVV